MTILNQMSVVIAGLIRSGAILRFIFCMIRLQAAEGDREMYQKRAKNTIIFMILAESVWVLQDIALHYYS